MAVLMPPGRQQYFDSAGDPLVGGKLYTYNAFTSTPRTTYADFGQITPNPNPVILDGRGEATVFWDGNYKVTLTDASDVTIWTVDGVQMFDDADITAIAQGLVDDLRDDLADTSSASNGGNLSGLNATLNYTLGLGRRAVLDFWSPADHPWLAKFDGVTDDTSAINACATACRAASPKKGMRLPMGTAIFSSTLVFDGLTVDGPGQDKSILQATSAQFDCITTTGETSLHGFSVYGGWNGVTPGLNGDAIVVRATSPAFPYVVHIDNVRVLNAKRRGIFVERGGYTSISRVRCNASGLHGLEMYGADFANACTTVHVGGSSIFSDCPNGRGVKITNGIDITLDHVISENTQGFEIDGVSNRNITISGCYQEGTSVANFITLTGAGIGLRLVGNYGVGFNLPYSANFVNTEVGADNTFNYPATAPLWKVNYSPVLRSATGAETTTSTTGGVNFTAASITLAPGIWTVQASMQTINSAGATLVSAGFRLTNNVAENVAQTTGAGFVADEVIAAVYGASAQSRPATTVIYENTTGADQTYYMRGYINISAGTIAYKGFMRAARIG